jgi:hypothetical protein
VAQFLSESARSEAQQSLRPSFWSMIRLWSIFPELMVSRIFDCLMIKANRREHIWARFRQINPIYSLISGDILPYPHLILYFVAILRSIFNETSLTP